MSVLPHPQNLISTAASFAGISSWSLLHSSREMLLEIERRKENVFGGGRKVRETSQQHITLQGRVSINKSESQTKDNDNGQDTQADILEGLLYCN
jgi:hypothetical protein